MFTIPAIKQLLDLGQFLIDEFGSLRAAIKAAKARGYQGDTDALLKAADEADAIKAAADARS